MAGYLIANLEITNPDGFAEYARKVAPIIAQYGGKYIVRGGETRMLEGNAPIKRIVILEFPSLAAAQKFYDSPDYRPIIHLRTSSANSTIFLVDGYAG